MHPTCGGIHVSSTHKCDLYNIFQRFDATILANSVFCHVAHQVRTEAIQIYVHASVVIIKKKIYITSIIMANTQTNEELIHLAEATS